MEMTKWLKPSGKGVTKYGDNASVQAVTRVNAEATNRRRERQRQDSAVQKPTVGDR